jgi:membrane protein YdbS with pleckstrin-like domain
MALMNCPECGREVSDQAEACPRCAYPIAKKSVVAEGGAPTEGQGPVDDQQDEPGGEPGGEHTIWAGTPSQLVNFKPFAGAVLLSAVIIAAPILIHTYFRNPFGLGNKVFFGFALLVIPLVILLWNWLQISSCRYELTNERIKLTTGVLSRKYETIELYRVKDIEPERPFIMRLFGLGNIVAHTSDKSMPLVTFWAVRGSTRLYEDLRKLVEQRRVQRRVREVDIE